MLAWINSRLAAVNDSPMRELILAKLSARAWLGANSPLSCAYCWDDRRNSA